MVYVAMVSLKQTINDVVASSSPPPPLSSAQNQTDSLLRALERRDRGGKRLDDLEGQIRDFAHKLEDALELHQPYQLEEEIASFVEFAIDTEKDYVQELSIPLKEEEEEEEEEEDADGIVMPDTDMVGHSGLFNNIRDRLLKKMRPDDTCFFSFLGDKGSHRTAAAKAIFDSLGSRSQQQSKKSNIFFDCCAWVAVGTKDKFKEILIRIVAQVDTLAAADYEELMSMENGKLCYHLYGILENRRYMIVLDDVRDFQVVLYLRRSLPDQGNGSLVILTTSIDTIAQLTDDSIGFNKPAHYFDEYMWHTLRVLMFSSRSISPRLEEAGKKIIQNCRRLNIVAAKTFLFLLKTKTVEQWFEIAADKENPIFVVVDEISEISKIKAEIQSRNWGLDSTMREVIFQVISTFIDFSDGIEGIKAKIHPTRFFSKMQIISLFGMHGIGKSTLAVKVFKDKSVLCYFDHSVWITLGPKYHPEKILIDILAQIYLNVDKSLMQRDEKLVRNLSEQVSCKRCLIVLDDLCDKEPLLRLKSLFTDINGTILVTTTLVEVAKFGPDDLDCEMKLLDEEESWRLLCQKVFGGEELCPPQLEKVGRKIAENCDGLPLLILTVAEELLKVEMSEVYWNNIVVGKEKSVFMNAHHKISKALLPTYQSLPQHLKACFLYMAVFREKQEISTSELIDLWVVEGFLVPYSPQTVEDYATECLRELVDRSLVMVQRKVSGFGFKTCRLHVVYWHISNGEALNNRFFHAMNIYDDCSLERIMDQRIICIRNNILLGIKDVQDSMESNTNVHSFLCVGPFQQYPVPINFDFRLLRLTSALTIRLYEFPIEVVRQVRLRYLGLTCNGKLPTSVSNLMNLQHLTLKRYMNIKSLQSSWVLPVEIWDMKELKHLQIMGGCLPNHNGVDGLLKLTTLLDVSAQCCREEVFEGIPNLKRLGIRIELEPDDKGTFFDYLNNISHLHGLESLKCVVVNPLIKFKVVYPPPPILMFPMNLKKLSLSGLGFSWKDMKLIEECKNLEVLKLKHYAFRGPKWEIEHKSILHELKFLMIEDSDLVEWKVTFGIMECLCIKHCYKLRELPIGHFKNIEIIDCNPLCATWALELGRDVSDCRANVHASWVDGKGGKTATRAGPSRALPAFV